VRVQQSACGGHGRFGTSDDQDVGVLFETSTKHSMNGWLAGINISTRIFVISTSPLKEKVESMGSVKIL
jgi:hypothetical protein